MVISNQDSRNKTKMATKLVRLYPAPGTQVGRGVVLAWADDRERTRLTGVLERHRFEVCPLRSGERAIELIESRGWPIAVLDSDLPDVSGLQVAQLLHYLWYLAGETANVNLIVASSPANYSKRECYAAGATNWLRKPLQADRLISVLEYHLVI